MTIPNGLSIMRAALGPVISLLLFFPVPWAGGCALALFIVASLTDYWDGYLARRWHQVSTLGALLDGLADKILICLTLVTLVGVKAIQGVHLIPVLFIVGREIVMAGLRAVPLTQDTLKVVWLAKGKTVCQMLAVGLTIGHYVHLCSMVVLAHIFLWIACALSLVTGASYLKSFYRSS